jgi:predicted amidohydrolase YtcJ
MVNTPSHQGKVFEKEHHAVREFVQRELPAEQRRKNIEAALQLAARQGIVSVHENGGPVVSGHADFADVMDFSNRKDMPEIYAYWGSTDLDEVRQLGAYGAAGDLTVDGSIGSRTALLNEEYLDNPAELSGNLGTEFLSVEQLGQHLINCTKIGIQGGFHAIGDRALDNVVEALQIAEAECGTAAVRAARHRIEHAEMLDTKHLVYLNSLGVVLSMQPVFDELWGNSDGLYDQRLGTHRSHQMNTFSSIAQSGITMAFSSDSPVTPIDPWRSVWAAVNHHTTDHRISSRAAFNAHTRGGWRAAKRDNAGVIAEGMLAHLAIWDASTFSITVPDDRVRNWSTDERSGTPPLPDLSAGIPRCVATIRAGQPIFDPEKIWQ